jgi:hypothetical protein
VCLLTRTSTDLAQPCLPGAAGLFIVRARKMDDPIYAAIERHRLADAAYVAALDRGDTEAVKAACSEREALALVAMLRTKPETLAGALAVLRYVADWAENNDVGLFQGWSSPQRSAGAAFLPMIADAIEAAA